MLCLKSMQCHAERDALVRQQSTAACKFSGQFGTCGPSCLLACYKHTLSTGNHYAACEGCDAEYAVLCCAAD